MQLSSRDRETMEGVGAVMGFLTFIGLLLLVIFWSIGVYNGKVEAQKHNPQWPTHVGIVVVQKPPVIHPDEAYKPSTVRYKDFYGGAQILHADLPYSSHVGDKEVVYVNSSGRVYAPGNLHNPDTFDVPNPHVYGSGSDGTLFPWAPIVIFGVIANFVASMILGFAYAGSLKWALPRWRLGKRWLFGLGGLRSIRRKLHRVKIRLRKHREQRPKPSRLLVEAEAFREELRRIEPSPTVTNAISKTEKLIASVRERDSSRAEDIGEMSDALRVDVDEYNACRRAALQELAESS